MLDSLIAYLGLMLIMMAFAWCGKHAGEYKKIYAGFAALWFAIVMGIRYNVGTDFDMYYNAYELARLGTFNQELTRWEIGFSLIFKAFAVYDFHYSIPFGLVAFFQCYLLFVGLKKQYRVWVYLPVTLMLSCIWITYDNIMRHMLAFSIFVAAIPLLAERKYVKFSIAIFVAFLLHKTAILLLIFILVYYYNEDIFKSLWLQLGLFLGSLVLMNIDIVQDVFNTISNVTALMGYSDYESSSFAEFDDEMKIGLGFIVILMIDLFLILLGNGMKKYYKSRSVNIMYDLFFLGVILRYGFLRMFLIQRLNYYFYSFEFIIAALSLYYLFKNRKYLMYYSILFLYVALFMGKMMQAKDTYAAYQTFLNK